MNLFRRYRARALEWIAVMLFAALVSYLMPRPAAAPAIPPEGLTDEQVFGDKHDLVLAAPPPGSVPVDENGSVILDDFPPDAKPIATTPGITVQSERWFSPQQAIRAGAIGGVSAGIIALLWRGTVPALRILSAFARALLSGARRLAGSPIARAMALIFVGTWSVEGGASVGRYGAFHNPFLFALGITCFAGAALIALPVLLRATQSAQRPNQPGSHDR
jgi:hypothetical protein